MNEQPQPLSEQEMAKEVCPRWCIADHENQGSESQRWHYSAGTELPLVELARDYSERGAGVVDAPLSFDVGLEQPWGLSATYVLLGVGSERARTFCVSLESAERLVEAMRDAIRLGRGTS